MANPSPSSVPGSALLDSHDTQQQTTAEPADADGNDNDSALGEDTCAFFHRITEEFCSSFPRRVWSKVPFISRREYGTSFRLFPVDSDESLLPGYFMPNDEDELDRLDIVHAMLVQSMDGELLWAPIGPSPSRVLDIGTGTGIWAIDFADQNPSTEVIGNDLSPTQPAWVPPNLSFIVDDIEDEWAYENDKFDYVHARYLAGAIKNWPRLIEQAFRNTKPGGWLEFQEGDFRYHCADGSVSRDSGIWSFHNHVCDRLEAAGFDASPGARLEKWFHDAGFVKVQAYCLTIPLGTWPKNKKLKRIGAFHRMQFDEGMEAIAIGCMTRASADERAWSMEEVQVLVTDARRDLENPNLHGHNNFYVVFGQVPNLPTGE